MIIVYNFISQITSFWLPYIRTHLGEQHKVPVILVGNKCDLMDFSTEEVWPVISSSSFTLNTVVHTYIQYIFV